jgi:hypothetical protein
VAGVSTGRRLLALVGVCALIGIPAGVLRATCAGKTCDDGTVASARVPFCPLPDPLKTLIANGYREGRSPDVLGVGAVPIAGGSGDGSGQDPWPDTSSLDPRVPVLLFGAGVDAGATLPPQIRLDRVAPTLADVIGFTRPHPEVRSGTPLPHVATGDRPGLLLEVAWTGGGTPEVRAGLSAAPTLRGLLRSSDVLAAPSVAVGSVPIDPAAVLTTLGTGGLPAQHGITASLIRSDDGKIVTPFGPGAPPSVISTLPDDLAQAQPDTKVGAVLPSIADRGIVGGTWYQPHPREDIVIDRRHVVGDVADLLARGYGADATPDVLAVVEGGSLRAFDDDLGQIIAEVRTAGVRATFMVTATGSPTVGGAMTGADVAERVDSGVPGPAPIVAAEVPGGLFLDQDVLAAEKLSSDAAVGPMLGMRTPAGGKVFTDAFPGFAVSFARYC